MANAPRQARPPVLLDTNLILYLYRGFDPRLPELIGDEYIVSNQIVMVEVLGWKSISADEEQHFRAFFKQADILTLTDRVFERAIIIRKQKRIALPDALIAATAIEHHTALWTANTDDFKNIPDLELYNPLT